MHAGALVTDDIQQLFGQYFLIFSDFRHVQFVDHDQLGLCGHLRIELLQFLVDHTVIFYRVFRKTIQHVHV